MGANGRHNGVVADADGHIMEPGNLWKENLEPRYRDRAMQVVSGEDGLDYLEIDGRGSEVLNGALGGLGTLDEGAAWRSKEHKPELLNWEDCRTPRFQGPSCSNRVDDRTGHRSRLPLSLAGVELADGVRRCRSRSRVLSGVQRLDH